MNIIDIDIGIICMGIIDIDVQTEILHMKVPLKTCLSLLIFYVTVHC